MTDVQKIQPPARKQYEKDEARFDTYATWPPSNRMSAQKLCDAGMFYTGEGDNTISNQCGGGIFQWDADDYPVIEHARWFAKCALARRVDPRKPGGDASTQTDFEDLATCKICLLRKINTVNLPCGHLVGCTPCAPYQNSQHDEAIKKHLQPASPTL